MPTRIALLRGINIGPHHRIAMPALRAALSDAGVGADVRTYVQSGNVVLTGCPLEEGVLCARVHDVIADTFGLDIPVVSRTREELAAVAALNPLGDVVTEPKRYQVSFLSGEPSAEVVERMRGLLAPGEAFAAHGRELYGWHPAGIARSKLWGGVSGQKLGVIATARNWLTVTALLELSA